MKRLVFLFDSTVEPWGLDVQAVRSALGRLEGKRVACEVVDTHGMADERLDYWREQATVASVWHKQAIRQRFGSRRQGGLPDFGKHVPALLVYEQGERVPVGVYPHSEARGDRHTDFTIEGYLEELMAAPKQGD
jgi:hypothetical protein